jgi:hypothetical protein
LAVDEITTGTGKEPRRRAADLLFDGARLVRAYLHRSEFLLLFGCSLHLSGEKGKTAGDLEFSSVSQAA